MDARLHLFIIFMFDNIIRLFLCLLYLHFPIKRINFVEDDWGKTIVREKCSKKELFN